MARNYYHLFHLPGVYFSDADYQQCLDRRLAVPGCFPLPLRLCVGPPPCHNQRLLGQGPGVGTDPTPSSPSTQPPPRGQPGAPGISPLDCVCITYERWCASRRSPGWSRWAYSWGAAGVPVPGFKLCSMFNHRGWSRAPRVCIFHL